MKTGAFYRPRFIIPIILLIMTLISSNLHWGSKNAPGVLEADARGYYAYLPALFIYDDLNFNFYDSIDQGKYYNEKLLFEYRAHVNDTTINKFYVGTAVAQLPLFLIAHVISPLAGYDQDGYSRLYMISVCISALLFLLTGLIFLNKFLQLYGINNRVRATTLIATVFATNIFYYTVVEAGMSHIYSFGWVCMFLYFVKIFFVKSDTLYIIFSAVLLGIIILARPVNGLIILIIPFLAGNYNVFKRELRRFFTNIPKLITAILIVLTILSAQAIIYKISTGSFFVYSYESEGFRFTDPHLIDILFSYKKGLFLYTPWLFISLVGLYFLFQRNKFQFYSLSAFLFALTYVLSSWWNWWYGGSFSSRVFLEFIPLFALIFAIAMQSMIPFYRKTFLVITVGCILLCQVQTYQYRYYQIHWENMTKEKYWDVFLRIDQLI